MTVVPLGCGGPIAARGCETARHTTRPWPTWRAATGLGRTASRICARRSGWTRALCVSGSRRGRSRRRDGVTVGTRLREHEPPAARRAGEPLSGVRGRGERGPAGGHAVRRLQARCGAPAGPHFLCRLRDAAHQRPLTVHLRRPAARVWHTCEDSSRAAGASGRLGADTRAQRVEYVLGRASDVVDLAIDRAHRGRVGSLSGHADDSARTQPDVPVVGLELDEVAHGRSPLGGPGSPPVPSPLFCGLAVPAGEGSGVTAVIAPWTAPVTAPLAAPVAAPTRALRTVVTACAIAAPAFFVTVCLPARAFVLVPFVCFASARLAWTFLVALAGLPVRASCFFGERFFRWGTARALGVLPREPARPRFSFGFRVGMVISSWEQ